MAPTLTAALLAEHGTKPSVDRDVEVEDASTTCGTVQSQSPSQCSRQSSYRSRSDVETSLRPVLEGVVEVPDAFTYQDLLLKSWSSWHLRDGEDARERATHVVLYYMIWWIFLPLPWLLFPEVKPLLLGCLCAIAFASNNHWRDVQYGERRHTADISAVTATFAVHFAAFFQGRELATCISLVLPLLPIFTVGLTSFAMAWYRHMRGNVEEGLFWHLLFRSLGTWVLIYLQAYDSQTGAAPWLAFIAAHTVLYWLMAWGLWVNAKRLLGVSEA